MAQPAFDSIDFNTAQTFPCPGVSAASIIQFDIGLLGVDTTLFSSDSPPTSPLPVADFQPSSLFFILLGCLDAEISSGSCSTESLEISAHLTFIPEPAPGLAGLPAAAVLARHR